MNNVNISNVRELRVFLQYPGKVETRYISRAKPLILRSPACAVYSGGQWAPQGSHGLERLPPHASGLPRRGREIAAAEIAIAPGFTSTCPDSGAIGVP